MKFERLNIREGTSFGSALIQARVVLLTLPTLEDENKSVLVLPSKTGG